MNLSERDVVKYLILNRNLIDIGYGANVNNDIYTAGDIFEFNIEILALYADLDKMVEESNLTNKQEEILHLFYDGNTVNDVAEVTNGNRVSTYRILDRIVEKITNTNNELWYYTMGNNNLIIKT